MIWFLVEALIALGLLLFLVWWTMFSGRPKPPAAGDDDDRPAPPR